MTEIAANWKTDPHIQQLLTELQANPASHSKYTWDGQCLKRKGKLVVGDNEEIKQKIFKWLHDSSQGGHSGIEATYQKIKSCFFWKGMKKATTAYVKKCITCQKCKYDHAAYPGLLQPLPVPNMVWEAITMDFIEGLPRSQGKEVILVVIDRLSKYAHFIALSHPYT